jgi:hypothetical protein
MANISVGFGTDLSLKATIKGIRIAIGTVNEDRINSRRDCLSVTGARLLKKTATR